MKSSGFWNKEDQPAYVNDTNSRKCFKNELRRPSEKWLKVPPIYSVLFYIMSKFLGVPHCSNFKINLAYDNSPGNSEPTFSSCHTNLGNTQMHIKYRNFSLYFFSYPNIDPSTWNLNMYTPKFCKREQVLIFYPFYYPFFCVFDRCIW